MSRFPDPIDAGSELAEREREALVESRRRERALRPRNTRGRCIDCSEPIDPQRLAIDATTRRCVECQHIADKRARFYR